MGCAGAVYYITPAHFEVVSLGTCRGRSGTPALASRLVDCGSSLEVCCQDGGGPAVVLVKSTCQQWIFRTPLNDLSQRRGRQTLRRSALRRSSAQRAFLVADAVARRSTGRNHHELVAYETGLEPHGD